MCFWKPVIAIGIAVGVTGCAGYSEEEKSEYNTIMMNGVVISSTTSPQRVTTSIVKYNGKLYSCYETGMGTKNCTQG